MTLIIGFTVDTRSQSTLNAGVKLHTYYRVSGELILNELRANLADYYIQPVSPPPLLDVRTDVMPDWRFGGLLKGNFSATPEFSEYGILFSEGQVSQNAGVIDLDYKVYVKNNPDDPAYFFTGVVPFDGMDEMDGSWDTDGKIVMTIQIFQAGDVNPIATVSHLVGITGVTEVSIAQNVGTEGSAYDQDNTGRGSLGEHSSLDLFRDTNQDMTAWTP